MELPPDIDFESGAADRPAFATNKERIEFYEHFTDDRPEKVLRHRAGHYPQQVVIAVALATLIVGLPASIFACRKMSIAIFAGKVMPYKFPVLEMGLFILVLFGMELILSVWTIRRQKNNP